MKGIAVLAMTLVAFSGISQRWPFEYWHEGKVILTDGDTLRGNVKYDLNQDLLQYAMADKSVTALTPRKVLSFEIFDVTNKQYRIFYALPYANLSGYKTPVFFELLAEGKLTLLARESLEYRTYSNAFYHESRQVLVNKYFFLEENGNIMLFDGKKDDLLRKMGRHAEEVNKYMRQNRLDVQDKGEFTRTVRYYNSLFRK